MIHYIITHIPTLPLMEIGAKIHSLGFFVKSPNYIQLCPCTLKIKEFNYNEVGDYFDNNDLITA